MARIKKSSQVPDNLIKEYKKLAKVADQRMVRLEQQSKKPGYASVTSFAYARAQYDISKWAGVKHKDRAHRFNIALPNLERADAVSMINRRLKDLKRFLNSETSLIGAQTDTNYKKSGLADYGIRQIGGIKSVYEKRVKTINEKYGTDFTWDELARYFELGMHEKMSKELGSKTALIVIGNMQKKGTELVDDIIKSGKTYELAKELAPAGKKQKLNRLLKENNLSLDKLR